MRAHTSLDACVCALDIVHFVEHILAPKWISMVLRKYGRWQVSVSLIVRARRNSFREGLRGASATARVAWTSVDIAEAYGGTCAD